MKIQLNGQPYQTADQASINMLLAELELGDKRLAVEVNEELVTRSLFDQHRLQENDRVEIVQAIGGG